MTQRERSGVTRNLNGECSPVPSVLVSFLGDDNCPVQVQMVIDSGFPLVVNLVSDPANG